MTELTDRERAILDFEALAYSPTVVNRLRRICRT